MDGKLGLDWLLNFEGMVGCLSTPNVATFACWWLSKVSSRRWLAYRNFHLAKLGKDLREGRREGGRARDGKGQRTTGKLEDSAAGSFRALLSPKLTFPPPPPPPFRFASDLVCFTYGLVREQRCLLTVFHLFFLELNYRPLKLEICTQLREKLIYWKFSVPNISIREQSSADGSLNLQGVEQGSKVGKFGIRSCSKNSLKPRLARSRYESGQ